MIIYECLKRSSYTRISFEFENAKEHDLYTTHRSVSDRQHAKPLLLLTPFGP